MKTKHRVQPRYRLLKAGCLGAGLLSISHPTQVTAADIGLYDVHNDVSLGSVANPFPSSRLGVHVAAGDYDGDGHSDIVMGDGGNGVPDPGAPGPFFAIRNFSKSYGDYLPAHLPTPGAGVRVAAGDLNGDGNADIVVTPGIGGPSPGTALVPETEHDKHIFVSNIGSTASIFDDFAGGVSIAVGDFEGDGVPDIIAGKAGAPGDHLKHIFVKVKITLELEDFYVPLPPNNGVEVAMGDIDGDGADEVLSVSNQSSDGFAHAFMANHKTKDWIVIDSFNEPAGVHVALGDVDGDGRADLAVGSPPGVETYIKFYSLEEDPTILGKLKAVQKFVFHKPFQKVELHGARVAIGDVNGDGYGDLVFAPASVPEPATIGSLLAALGTWLFGGRWRRRAWATSRVASRRSDDGGG